MPATAPLAAAALEARAADMTVKDRPDAEIYRDSLRKALFVLSFLLISIPLWAHKQQINAARSSAGTAGR